MPTSKFKDGIIEISDSTYFIGRREGVLLERNTYLRIFKVGKTQINLLIDPGPPEDLEIVVENINKLIGDVRKINLIFINHQDPDVAHNISFFSRMNPKSLLLASEDTWRLARFYGWEEKRFKPVERFKKMRVSLSTGHILQFVPTPYCHFRGAVALYDVESRILFSGDLFGGLSYGQQEDIFADTSDFDGIKAFHQIYMPHKAALEYAINNIKQLNPPPFMIAPQHGRILSGPMVEHYIDKIAKLEVGLDLFLQTFKKDSYASAMTEMLRELTPVLGTQTLAEAASILNKDSSFPDSVIIDSDGVRDIKLDPTTALDLFIKGLQEHIPSEKWPIAEMKILKIISLWDLPTPESINVSNTGETPEFFDEEEDIAAPENIFELD